MRSAALIYSDIPSTLVTAERLIPLNILGTDNEYMEDSI